MTHIHPAHLSFFQDIYVQAVSRKVRLINCSWTLWMEKFGLFVPFSRAPIMSANPPFGLEFASRPTNWQHFFRIPLTAPQFGEKLNRQDFKGAQDLPKGACIDVLTAQTAWIVVNCCHLKLVPRQFGNPITRGIYDVLIKKDSAGGLGTTGQRVLTNSSWQQGLQLCPQLWTIMTISLQSEV